MLGKAVWLHSSEGAEATIIDGEYVRRGIFCNSGETLNTIIEGFMITNGNATSGAGMKCLNYSRPTILDCIFLNNTAVGQNGLGGGIYCHQYATPRIESCTFMNNDAGQGGGFYCYGVGEILINDCNFIGNSSLSKGGAISCEHTDISLELCSFQNNDGGDSSFGYGGALSVWNSTATLIDCDFIGNSIENKGGAIDFWNLDAVMTNCTFENNSANYGAGINCGYSEITAVNCSMSGNTALILGSGIYVYYSSVKFVDANEFDEIFVIDESEISFVADSICNVNGDVATSSAGKIRFDIDDLSADGMLALSEAFTRQGGLGVTNNSSSLLQAIAGEIIPLAYSSNIYGSWDSIVLPTMSNGLGLQLIEYPAFREGGDDGVELAVEVIEVEEVDFADPFTGNLDSPPIDIVAFDADGDGEDELAILFSGMSGFGGSPGGVVVFDISEDGDPVLIEGFSAIVGNNPVDIDAGDLNGDGLEDIIVANGESGTMSILLTTLQGDDSLSFTANTISGSNYFSTVAVIDWDNNDQLDAVVGINVVDTDLLDGFQILLDVADGTSFGPFFEVPKYVLPTYQLVSDPPTCVHGGKKNSSWGFVGATRYGRVYRATLGGSLELLGELGGSNIVTIEAIELDSLGGDGQIDLIVSSDEAEAIYLFQGNDSETDGFGDLIPLAVSEPVQDVLAIDADDDGDMDLVMAAPTSDTPLVLLRNDGGGTELVGGLNGITWSKQAMNSGNPLSDIEPIDVNDDKDIKQVVVGAGDATNLRGELAGTMEQTNILLSSDCAADIDGDGNVNVSDLLIIIDQWGLTNSPADVNDDGIVDVSDLLIVSDNWGPCE
jgi:predicted outer membrane repeat protein